MRPGPVLPTRRPSWRSGLVTGLVVALVFVALDAVWLTTMMDRLYRPRLGHLLREQPDLIAALAFYALYLPAIVGFAVAPARSTFGALGRGAAFGLVAYGTYDLTNQATMRDWSWLVTAADLAWGALVTGVSAALGYRGVAARRGDVGSTPARS